MPFVIPLLPELGIAAPIIALIFAGVLLLKMIGNILPSIHLPVIGSLNLGAPFVAAGQAVETWIVNNTKHLWYAVTHWIAGLAFDSYHTLASTVHAVLHLGDHIAYLATHSIPQAISHAVSEAAGYADHKIAGVLRTLHGTKVMLEQLAVHALNAAKADVAEVRGTVNQIVRPAIGHLEGDVASLDRTVFGDLTHGLAGLESTVTSLEQTVGVALGHGAGSIEGEIGAAVGAAERLAGRALDGAIGTLEGDIADVGRLAREALDGGAGTLLSSVAATAAAAMALATKLESCAVTKCAGPNNLSSLLNDLAGAADYATLAAFVSEAVQHPAAAGRTFEAGAHQLYDTGSSLLNSLLAL